MALGGFLGAVVNPFDYGLSKLTGGLYQGIGSLTGGGGGGIPGPGDVIGGLTGQTQSEAALKAAQLQYQAAQEAMKQQREMFDILNQQQAPYRQAGYTSLNALNALLGLPPAYSTQEAVTGPVSSAGIPTAAAPSMPSVGVPGGKVVAPPGMMAAPTPQTAYGPDTFPGGSAAAALGGAATVPGALPDNFVFGNQGGLRPAKPVIPGSATTYYRGGPSAAVPAADSTTRGGLSGLAHSVTGGLGKITGSIGNVVKPIGNVLETVAKPVITGGASLIPGVSNAVGKITGGGVPAALLGGGLGVIDPISAGLAGGAGKIVGGLAPAALAGGAIGAIDPLTGGLLSNVLGGSSGGGMGGALGNAPPAGAGPTGAGPAQRPMVSPGYQAGEGLAGFGALTRPFTAADLQSQLAPNYQFMLQQGLGAVRQGQNVTGGGSNIQRAATKFAEDYASNAYQNALQNYMAQQQSIYNRLSGIAGIGQTAQGQQLNMGTNLANALSQLGIGGASALGSGQVGAANAQTGALQNLAQLGTLALLA